MIDVHYATLAAEVESGEFRRRLEAELMPGFRTIHESGERLPTASHYAAQIAEIVARAAPAPLASELAYEVYQEILAACEHTRNTVLGETPS